MGLYILGWTAGFLLFLLGAVLVGHVTNPSNLYFTSIAFLFAGPAIFLLTFTSWFNNRYHRYPLLVIGIVLAGLLFVTAFVFAMVSLFF